MIKINKKNNRKKTGFTLVETLVALFIFSVSILTTMSVLSQGLTSANYAKNKMVAGYLSQEGIEYFRNMRDTYLLYSDDKTQGWTDFVLKLKNNGCGDSNGCYFDNDVEKFSSSSIKDIGVYSCSGKCNNLSFVKNKGEYDYSGVERTTFSRKMKIEESGEYVKIISEVTWSSGGQGGMISLSENLLNWIE